MFEYGGFRGPTGFGRVSGIRAKGFRVGSELELGLRR